MALRRRLSPLTAQNDKLLETAILLFFQYEKQTLQKTYSGQQRADYKRGQNTQAQYENTVSLSPRAPPFSPSCQNIFSIYNIISTITVLLQIVLTP